MGRNVFVSLLKSIILLDVMQVVPPDHNCPFHFLALHNPIQNSTTNAHIPSEWTLLVYVGTLCGLYHFTRERARVTPSYKNWVIPTSLGVLNPRPTFLVKRTSFFFFPPPVREALLFWKVNRCF